MKPVYMLDTNTVSFLVRKHPVVRQRILSLPPSACCLSVITEAELRFGLARRPEATQLARLVGELLMRLPSLSWDSAAANSFATLRANAERHGITVGTMDMLIAAHAHANGLTLVTNDAIFTRLDALRTEDWTQEASWM